LPFFACSPSYTPGLFLDAMFAASLNTLKKRTSQFLKGDERRENENYESFNLSSEAEFSTAPTIEGQLVVRYKVQNDVADSEPAIFLLNVPNLEDFGITGAVIRAQFPLPGSFHFRFKAVMSDGSFGGYVWADLANDEEFAPVFRGEICMKALKLPDGNEVRMHDTITESRKIPPFQESFVAQQTNGVTLPVQTGLDGLEPPSFDDELSEPPPFGGAGGLTNGRSNHDERPAPAPTPAPAPPPPPPSDLIEVDLTGGHSGGGGPTTAFSPPSRAPPAPAPAPAMPPPVPVKIFDRQQLVQEREAKCQARVDEANRIQTERRMSEEQLKKDKLKLGYELVAEMDKWAKTADGSKFKDIRTLISTMDTVLWPNCNWKPVSLSELVANNSNTKKFYRKAILMCHPDRHQDASAEQQVRADRIFEALNSAFKAAGDQ